jgi:uncharacterized protein (TIGR03437 family)
MKRGPTLLLIILCFQSLAGGQPLLPSSYTITTVAGTSFAGDGGRATAAPLASVEGLAVDGSGNLFIADAGDHRVRRVSTTGVITTVAGNGSFGVSGDGGPASSALLNRPYGLAFDPAGNLYIADLGNQRIRRITPEGVIDTVAGSGAVRPPGEGGEAAAARFQLPRNVVADRLGNLYISDFGDHRVYRMSLATGRIDVAAGTGVAGFTESGEALSVRLNGPTALAVDAQGVLYIADSGNRAIRRLAAGRITTLVGGLERSVPLEAPTGLAVARDGTLYIADGARLYRRSPAGELVSIAQGARDVVVDPNGVVYYGAGGFVYRLNGTGTPVVWAGDGSYGVVRENVDAGLAYLQGPTAVALDDMGSLYIAEQLGKRVRQVTPAGVISTFAGGGTGGLGDNGPAVNARLFDPAALVFDPLTGFRIADSLGSRVRSVNFSGIIRTEAGNGEYGFSGDGGPALEARLNKPGGVALDRSGNLYIADTYNNRIRRVTPAGVISTFAGTGVRGYFGDGGNARQAQLSMPQGLAMDHLDNLYIADTGNNVIRRVTPAGVISTVAGSGLRGFGGDNGPALQAAFHSPTAVAVDMLGTLYIADRFNNRIRRVAPDGTVTTIAGDGVGGFAGDGGPAARARLNSPTGVAVDARGNVFVADTDNNRVRRLTPSTESPQVPGEVTSTEVLVMNAASFRSGPLAPGTIVSLFGAAIGPPVSASGKLNAAGRLDVDLQGTQVRFDGVAAPLFYVSPDQINVQVPYGVAGKEQTEIEIVRGGATRARLRVPVAEAMPGVFTMQAGVGQVVATNEDGTLNSPENPALRGSIVTIYATGEGATTPMALDGMPAAAPLPVPVLTVQAQVGNNQAEVLWAGAAPGYVGLLQINLRLPGPFSPPGIRPLTLYIGGIASQPGVTIAVR